MTAYFDLSGNLYQNRGDIEPKRRPAYFQLFGAGPIVRVESKPLWSASAKRHLLHTENRTVTDEQFFRWVNGSKERVIDVTVRLLTDLSAEGDDGDIFWQAAPRQIESG